VQRGLLLPLHPTGTVLLPRSPSPAAAKGGAVLGHTQVKRLFPRSYIVGRSFPVCHVHQEGLVMEVSSFSTKADASRIPPDVSGFLFAGRHSTQRIVKVRAPVPASAPVLAIVLCSAAVRQCCTHRLGARAVYSCYLHHQTLEGS
jgi:hypothetical protein